MSRTAAAVALALALLAPAAPTAAGPKPLSADRSQPSIASDRGSGAFGTWFVDRFGLPAYSYALDQDLDARAALVEVGGRRDNWSQVGNDAIVANAFNHGYTQLFSQARTYEWANRYQPGARQYAGGFGWLRRPGGAAISTLWGDRPRKAGFRREFGAGYARKVVRSRGIEIDERTTAPFGDDPALVHEVRVANETEDSLKLSWWEYWGANPYDETLDLRRGLEPVRFDSGSRTLSVRQAPNALDQDPLTIFLAADAPVSGFEADTDAFFGDGSRRRPAAVAADKTTGARAPARLETQAGRAMFALRSPLRLGPGQARTLRFVYGIAHSGEIPAIVARVTRGASTWARSSGRWARWLPRADLGRSRRWLARELAWDGYMTRSSAAEEEVCGHKTITQGGYYQYGGGQQIAFRDPLQHMLPMVYAQPELAREVLRYSFQQQDALLGQIAYGMGPMCTRLDVGTSNDLDFWLLLGLTEYVLASRDLGFLDEQVPYRGGLPAGLSTGEGSVWDHVKLAVRHQESLPGRGPAGHYVMGVTGDWSDFSTETLGGATESVLVTAQLAYVYPRLAEVAELRGDDAFAAELRRLGARNLALIRDEWTGKGWYARAYRLREQIGAGAIYLEPQPWAVLAGAPSRDQSQRLVANIERFLQGRGAPKGLGGPTKIGTSQSPAEADPEVTETDLVDGVGDGNAVFVGGTWYALNGPLAWALGELHGTVARARDRAFRELRGNTLTAHAEAFPEHWHGVLHVDDACNSFYASAPDECGIALLYDLNGTVGQITHQPAWGLLAALRLAGIAPTGAGYEVAPKLPLRRYSLRLPRAGIEVTRRSMRGYLRLDGRAPLDLVLDPPGNRPLNDARIWINGRRVPATPIRNKKALRIHARAGGDRPLDYALTWR